mmetsp:Transcript_23023/g.75040  ORF Transcript_23023/g.75040 Transcript_23023/m.75040 type:complete len:239 (-) Transcript_23023:63-779(-)
MASKVSRARCQRLLRLIAWRPSLATSASKRQPAGSFSATSWTPTSSPSAAKSRLALARTTCAKRMGSGQSSRGSPSSHTKTKTPRRANPSSGCSRLSKRTGPNTDATSSRGTTTKDAPPKTPTRWWRTCDLSSKKPSPATSTATTPSPSRTTFRTPTPSTAPWPPSKGSVSSSTTAPASSSASLAPAPAEPPSACTSSSSKRTPPNNSPTPKMRSRRSSKSPSKPPNSKNLLREKAPP